MMWQRQQKVYWASDEKLFNMSILGGTFQKVYLESQWKEKGFNMLIPGGTFQCPIHQLSQLRCEACSYIWNKCLLVQHVRCENDNRSVINMILWKKGLPSFGSLLSPLITLPHFWLGRPRWQLKLIIKIRLFLISSCGDPEEIKISLSLIFGRGQSESSEKRTTIMTMRTTKITVGRTMVRSKVCKSWC